MAKSRRAGTDPITAWQDENPLKRWRIGAAGPEGWNRSVWRVSLASPTLRSAPGKRADASQWSTRSLKSSRSRGYHSDAVDGMV